jgi:hypothetical protein
MRKEHRWRVFENRVLRRIFGPRRDKVKGKRDRAENEELTPHQKIIRVIKSRRMR